MPLRYFLLATLVAGNVLLPFTAHAAASCRAAIAAQQGAQTGYNRDKQAAQSWADSENHVSNGAQQCLGDISTTLTIPVFPDLNALLKQIIDKVCDTARDKIHQYIPSNIDPWGNIPTQPINLNTSPPPIQMPVRRSVTYISPPPGSQIAPSTPTVPAPDSNNGEYLFSP
ncbi:hypothetical protein FOT62_21455 [Serratia marcescens]|uniref:TraL n=1 Tax=Serratia marcescens TaxID=615 RepID=A0A5C7C629_SERMA|nr:hypothetical protein [Serratia marcescens]TXE28335.1 hypothetical protein FOT62_21455 [Serratia marcescens]TXE56857.1 hypothetical protein FOT56_23600 [Serratia marcescens]